MLIIADIVLIIAALFCNYKLAAKKRMNVAYNVLLA